MGKDDLAMDLATDWRRPPAGLFVARILLWLLGAAMSEQRKSKPSLPYLSQSYILDQNHLPGSAFWILWQMSQLPEHLESHDMCISWEETRSCWSAAGDWRHHVTLIFSTTLQLNPQKRTILSHLFFLTVLVSSIFLIQRKDPIRLFDCRSLQLCPLCTYNPHDSPSIQENQWPLPLSFYDKQLSIGGLSDKMAHAACTPVYSRRRE